MRLVRELTSFPEADRATASALAVGSLMELDAIIDKEFPEFGAASMAFDPSGQRLLMGGCTDPRDRD